jgi:hypothetical protein
VEDEVIVWDRPGGGAAPKMFENAASLSWFEACPPYWFGRGGPDRPC